MKKILTIILLLFLLQGQTHAVDKFSKEYLQSHKHFAITNPFVEKVIEHKIRKTIKKQTGVNYKVKFTGYTLSSMKKGIFKSFELIGKNVTVGDIPIPYAHVVSETDYNYIDYTQSPIAFKSDMKFAYEALLSEESLNIALNKKEYQKIINRVNKFAFPMFRIYDVQIKLKNNRIYVLTEYNFPIGASSKNRTFVASSDFNAQNGNILAKNVQMDSAYGKLPLNKVVSLINLLNPIGYTVDLFETKQCHINIENVNIVDNKVKVNGKIFIKGDE